MFNSEYAESDLDKANMLNNYFPSISKVDDENKNLPSFPIPQHANLRSIAISPQDVRDVLLTHDVTKACGPDFMSAPT